MLLVNLAQDHISVKLSDNSGIVIEEFIETDNPNMLSVSLATLLILAKLIAEPRGSLRKGGSRKTILRGGSTRLPCVSGR